MEFHLSLFKSIWSKIQKYKVNKIFKKYYFNHLL